jgi:hypothetical protein
MLSFLQVKDLLQCAGKTLSGWFALAEDQTGPAVVLVDSPMSDVVANVVEAHAPRLFFVVE